MRSGRHRRDQNESPRPVKPRDPSRKPQAPAPNVFSREAYSQPQSTCPDKEFTVYQPPYE